MNEMAVIDHATLGGGCFWCLDAIYRDVKGVTEVECGYAGGHIQDPTYEQVCGKTTGHIEVVQLTFDPAVITYESILNIFWHIHDPTTYDKQGADVGPQYRSAIFFHSNKQQQIAEKSLAEIDKSSLWKNPIVTELRPLMNYFSAEAGHQNYYNQNQQQGYCSIVIGPKIAKFKKENPHLLK